MIVVGAGAAGTLAATFCAQAGVATLLVDARRQPGAKIRVSGGGRCNVLPSHSEWADFETRGSSHLMRHILASWPRDAVQRYFEHDLQLPLVREPSGKLFPQSNRSRDVVDALMSAVAAAGVHTRFETKVVDIAAQAATGYELRMDDGTTLRAERVVLATGGLSMPRTGSDGSGWRMLRRLGHRIETPVAALVPLHGSALSGATLAGLSVPARLTWMNAGRSQGSVQGDFLFTHRGYSGPVVLDASRHFTLAEASRSGDGADAPMPTLHAAFGPAAHARCATTFWREALRSAGAQRVAQVVRTHLPRRLADALLACGDTALADARACELPKGQRQSLIAHLAATLLPVETSEGYRTAEVTSGGVPLSEISFRTLESRRRPGLYICGESLDASGRLGGFNFLWAWVTGRRAGEAAAQSLADVRAAG